MKSFGAILLGSLALIPTLCFAQKSESVQIRYNPDKTIKAKVVSEHQNGKIFKREILNAAGKLEFTEVPIYLPSGKLAGTQRLDVNGKPWPYGFAVYGAAALGGIVALDPVIQEITSELAGTARRHGIMEMSFSSPHQVEVITRNPETKGCPRGERYSFEKKDGKWRCLQTGMWVS
jgi:hypothetical protein